MAPAPTYYDLYSPLDLAPSEPPAVSLNSRLEEERALIKRSRHKQGGTGELIRRTVRVDKLGLHLEARSGRGGGATSSFEKRATLEPNHTQSVTLGVIGA